MSKKIKLIKTASHRGVLLLREPEPGQPFNVILGQQWECTALKVSDCLLYRPGHNSRLKNMVVFSGSCCFVLFFIQDDSNNIGTEVYLIITKENNSSNSL